MKRLFLCVILLCTLLLCTSFQGRIGVQRFEKGYRYEEGGWIFVHIEGEPFERGRQEGYLLFDRFLEAMRVYTYVVPQILGVEYSFFVKSAVDLHKKKIPEELLQEMAGMAAGLTEAGMQTTVDDIIGWNAFVELSENWWPQVKGDYVKGTASRKQGYNCSAFIATGSATKDHEIVIGHTTFDDYWNASFDNIILDILPSHGNRILMQTEPCFLSSMEDFFITGGGIVGVETTIAGFTEYDSTQVPEYVRARLAMQYATDIDSFVEIIHKENNGGVAAVWLIGDVKTNEIAKFEDGLNYHHLERKKDGAWFGANVADDPQIRNLECSGMGYNDVRRQTGARRVRWPVLLDKFDRKIDAESGKDMLADHFDVYTKKKKGSARTICAHYDEDPRKYMSSPDAIWVDPFTPAGSIDSKVTTSSLAKEMKFWGRFGRACGKPFDVKKFLKKHPQWSWQKDILQDRPQQTWVLFKAEEKR
jgi:hypothetical protein